VLEAQRIVKNAVEDAHKQFKSCGSSECIVLVRPDYSAEPAHLVQEVGRWFSAEGIFYKDIVGVLLCVRDYPAKSIGLPNWIDALIPVWRPAAPEWLKAGPWDRLTEGLNLRWLLLHHWRRTQRPWRTPAAEPGGGTD
jgi:hypothetical protein